MKSKIMETIPCQFSSSWSSNKCHICLLAKCIVWVLPPGGLSESPKFTKISCKPGHGLSSRKKKTRCGIACVPGNWEDATRFVLVVSFLIWMVQLVQEDPTHIPYILYTRIHIQQWKRAVLLGSLLQATRKVKRKWRKLRACCFVWENVPFWNCRLFTNSCFDFSTMFESCWSKNCTNLLSSIHDQSARARPLAWFDLQNATS